MELAPSGAYVGMEVRVVGNDSGEKVRCSSLGGRAYGRVCMIPVFMNAYSNIYHLIFQRRILITLETIGTREN